MFKLAFIVSLLFAATVNAQEDATPIIQDECLAILEATIAAHTESPTTAVHEGTLSMGVLYNWHDAINAWAVMFLRPTWKVRKQGWGKDFEYVTKCKSGTTVYNVWFSRYAPDEA